MARSSGWPSGGSGWPGRRAFPENRRWWRGAGPGVVCCRRRSCFATLMADRAPRWPAPCRDRLCGPRRPGLSAGMRHRRRLCAARRRRDCCGRFSPSPCCRWSYPSLVDAALRSRQQLIESRYAPEASISGRMSSLALRSVRCRDQQCRGARRSRARERSAGGRCRRRTAGVSRVVTNEPGDRAPDVERGTA